VGIVPQGVQVAPIQSAATEADLKTRLQALEPARPISEVKILKDGLMVDGQRFADAEGRAIRFATDAANGRVGYLVSGSTPDLSTFKIARADKPAEAITIGQLRKQGSGWHFNSVTGKSLSGELFFPLTDGILLMRDSVGFKYQAGEGIQQINVPTGWYPTSIQRGNISTTGWMLLEKDTTESSSSLLGVFGQLGKIVGAVDANEYALMQLSSGKLVEIDLSAEGKKAYSYSQCRRANAVMNACDKMTSYESAFKSDGTPNPTHYLWNVDWQRTSEGSILLGVEGSLGKRLSGWDLESGKKVTLFERTLGVVMQNTRVTPDGKLTLVARLGLSSETLDDVAAAIRQGPALATSASK
jgi:hypothetical protein